MRFKLDENLPSSAAAPLEAAGHDAETVSEEGLAGNSDLDVYDSCQRESRVLVTLDKGFGNIRSYPPTGSAGVILLRVPDQSAPAVVGVIESLVRLLADTDPRGHLWVVGPDSVRIHPGADQV